MKHTVIAAAALVIVALYSLFTFFYVKDFTDKMDSETVVYSTENIVMVRNIFEKKKKVLNFVINKEHLNDVENCIISLENSAKYNNTEQTEENMLLLKAAVEEIRHHNQCVI